MNSKTKFYTYAKEEGKRAKRIGETWEGFPMDGVWLVKDGKSNRKCILHSKDKIEDYNIPNLAKLNMINDKLTKALTDFIEGTKQKTFKQLDGGGVSWTYPSVQDMVDCVCQTIAKYHE